MGEGVKSDLVLVERRDVEIKSIHRLQKVRKIAVSAEGRIAVAITREEDDIIELFNREKKHNTLKNECRRLFGMVFIVIDDEENLAVAYQDGTICLWKPNEFNKPKVAYQEEIALTDVINLCCISHYTAALLPVDQDSTMSKVYILNTKSTKWTLMKTIELENKRYYDMCPLNMPDGTMRLVLCSLPSSNAPPEILLKQTGILAVDADTGKTVWHIGIPELGENPRIWGVSADEKGKIYALDARQRRVYQLSGNSGRLEKTILTKQDGLFGPTCLAVQNGHLYVAHEDEEGSKFQISIYKI